MKCITRSVIRWGLFAGIALGGVTLLVGPERVAAGFDQIRSYAQKTVDSKISDPVALRRQLSRLADEYPSRIAEVRGEVAEVNHQLGQIERDVEIAERIIAMTTDDLKRLKTLVTRAENEQEAKARPVSIRFDGVRYNVEQAYYEARRINNVRTGYLDRLEQDRQQYKFLNEQKSRLGEILAQLETEFDQFQAQLWQLDRQIDSIERNERLIQLTEKQQATLDNFERYGKVGNLKQVEGKLAQLRAVQEAQLQTLERRGVQRDYEARARFNSETESFEKSDPFRDVSRDVSDEVEADETEGRERDRNYAWNKPIVIE
ncbi:MAG: hypothetical protein EA377_07665 [Phycisphaerales bacterium]|nr:MAG: hypothetical protein EA377_07665 [Phycisphaerales bacterium]